MFGSSTALAEAQNRVHAVKKTVSIRIMMVLTVTLEA
jgi:hypothetical protein